MATSSTPAPNSGTNNDAEPVGSPANPDRLPANWVDTNTVVPVEDKDTGSGYVISHEDTKARPYLVKSGSALNGPPWNVGAGQLQGGYANPPLSAELQEELGLSDKQVAKLEEKGQVS